VTAETGSQGAAYATVMALLRGWEREAHGTR